MLNIQLDLKHHDQLYNHLTLNIIELFSNNHLYLTSQSQVHVPKDKWSQNDDKMFFHKKCPKNDDKMFFHQKMMTKWRHLPPKMITKEEFLNVLKMMTKCFSIKKWWQNDDTYPQKWSQKKSFSNLSILGDEEFFRSFLHDCLNKPLTFIKPHIIHRSQEYGTLYILDPEIMWPIYLHSSQEYVNLYLLAPEIKQYTSWPQRLSNIYLHSSQEYATLYLHVARICDLISPGPSNISTAHKNMRPYICWTQRLSKITKS